MLDHKFSKDPNVKLVSVEKFLNEANYLIDITKDKLWNKKIRPNPCGVYYKFTSQYLIQIKYTYTFKNFGSDICEKLHEITVAKRDGISEYSFLDNKISELIEAALHEDAERLINSKKLLPKFRVKGTPSVKPYEEYLVDTGYITKRDDLRNKYIVIDVETNGLRKTKDDLLSISIYDPTTGMCYNRFLPLDQQPMILTTFINGIDDKTLDKACHMSQDEVDWIYNYFDLNQRTILSYSGGKGLFDLDFVVNYLKRHNISGFNDLKSMNIKQKVPPAPYGCSGRLTKDNLCEIFGIEGVSKTHTSYNDCILEWKLFEILEQKYVFFIEDSLYKYSPDYIIPFSYLFQNEEVLKRANVIIPDVKGRAQEIFRFSYPKNKLKEIKKFPTNITGITIEHGINTHLNAEREDNTEFLSKNKSHLQYIGSFGNNLDEIPIMLLDDGMVKAVYKEDQQVVDEVNRVTNTIIENIAPVAEFLKTNIFKNSKIRTQEISVTDDGKVMALCDLSDRKNVVEIKTHAIETHNGFVERKLATQLYYQSQGRNTYVLSLDFETHMNIKSRLNVVDDLQIVLYRVDLEQYDSSAVIKTKTLNKMEIELLTSVKNNPDISKATLCRMYRIKYKVVSFYLGVLERFKYIEKENPLSKNSKWRILRSIDDVTTNYKEKDGEVIIVE